MMIFEVLFYSVSALVIYFGFKNIERKSLAVNLPSTFLGLGEGQAKDLLSTLKGFYFYIIISIIILFLLLIINWSFFKGLNWSIALKKKFNLNFLKRFFILNTVWFTFWILIIFFAQLLLKPNILLFFNWILAAIIIHLSIILYILFTLKSNMESVKETFKLSFKKIHYFILPYVIIILFIYMILKLSSSVNFTQMQGLIFSILLISLIVSWSRLYMVEIVNRVRL